ncbi:THUMP domain-containing protein 3 [Etheostoma cragini]|uniref:THUMP domain-containing protein 3 n=1 Tax=Etheostoma cragini TaxID=417921 RepID=UPI00155E62A1|nr:THUMP domain-containing protein 3 [Etheostoma cragini]XP_034726140.1 THUMP domain-containing protein 3 [Etheostoma cragini]XP_034726141.1 THUMP domain-containing protein 3 [Etheostoma cragini]
MSSQDEDGIAEPGHNTSEPSTSSSTENDETTEDIITVTIGATVPTGFEHTAAEEVNEKIGVDARISKDRGRIYFPITTDKLFQVHLLRSVDNLFVVVEEYDHYQFKESKEETLMEMQQLASKLPWTKALEVWKRNGTLKKKKGYRKGGNGIKVKPNSEATDAAVADTEQQELPPAASAAESLTKVENTADMETSTQELEETVPEAKPIKFRVTCNRAGDKHSFSSNEAARDFGGAVQEFFLWKADMTKFDIEVLLNIHNEEMVIGIALTEESLHRRNISHFGPTTLRSTLCYGMLRLCKPQASDIILDPMCGTGAIPLEGAIEFNSSFYIAGDNNDMAVNRTVNNICHIQKRRAIKGSASGLPIDTVRWDLCNLPIRTGSVDIIITDMPFGKRMGSRKKNWDLYPSCLREMARVCTPGSGKAVLLTQDKKCLTKAISRMGGLWRKLHTVWVNVGGLHAGVYLLKRTGAVFGQTPEDVYESRGTVNAKGDEKGDKELS